MYNQWEEAECIELQILYLVLNGWWEVKSVNLIEKKRNRSLGILVKKITLIIIKSKNKRQPQKNQKKERL